MQESGLAPE